MEFLKIIGEVAKRVGWGPPVLIALSFATLSFRDQLDLGDDVKAIDTALLLIAGFLFAIGTAALLLKLSGTLFVTRPARGLVDGLLVGIFVGLIGGAFGYGYGDLHVYPNGFVSPHIPRTERIFLVLVFSVPTSAMLGIILDLFRPDYKVNYKQYFSILALSILLLSTANSLAIALFVPFVDGPGITYYDLQFLFEIFLFLYVCVYGFSKHWSRVKFLSRALILMIAIIIGRGLTALPVSFFGTFDIKAPIGEAMLMIAILDSEMMGQLQDPNLGTVIATVTYMICLIAYTCGAFVVISSEAKPLQSWDALIRRKLKRVGNSVN